MYSQEIAVALIHSDPITVLIASVNHGSQSGTEHISDVQGREVFRQTDIIFENCTAIDAGHLNLVVEDAGSICAVFCSECVVGGAGGQLKQIVKDVVNCLCDITLCRGDVHTNGIIGPNQNFIHIACGTLCCPLLCGERTERGLFRIGQNADRDVAVGGIRRLRGLSGIRGLNNLGISQLFRAQDVSIGELHCIQFRNAHNAFAFDSAVVFGVKYIVYCKEIAVSLVDCDIV